MQIVQKTKGYDILSSGMAITCDHSSDLTLEINTSSGFNFNLIFKFDDSDNEKKLLSRSVDDQTVTLTCTNFNDALGTGTKEPIEIATISGKKIFIHFWVYSLGDKSTRKIEYSFYRES